MDILFLVDRLENLVATSKRMPLVNQVLIKETDIQNLIEQMRTVIPEEVKQARHIVQERERILNQARAEAATLLARTHDEAERTMSHEGLLRSAEERSREIIRRTEEQAKQMLYQTQKHQEQMEAEADTYALETLHSLREHLDSVETEISRTILSIEKGIESLEAQQYPQADNAEGRDENVEEDNNRGNMQGPNQTPPMPRRASLANDTIGG